ncbi:ATP-grasp domain-containing protein [Pseudomonadota bacterium]
MTKKTVLILGAGLPQIPAIARAHRLGYKVLCPDINPAAPGLSMCDYPLPGVSTHNPDEILNALRGLQKRSVLIDGALTMAVEASFSSARVCEALGLPSVSVATADQATNKLERLRAWYAAGVSCPKFGVADNAEEAARLAGEIKLPVVLKPLHRAGAQGVVRCDTEEEIHAMFDFTMGHAKGQVLIEEFIEGTEHSSESLVLEGRVYTTGFSDRNYDTKYKYPPHLLENGDTTPTSLDDDVYRKALSEVEKAIKALGIDFGPAKGDILVTPEGKVYILEMATRLSGDYFCGYTTPYNNGTDIISAALQQCVGDPVNEELLDWQYNRGVALRYFWPDPLPGRIVSIQGLEECRNLPGVRFVTWEPYWIDKQINIGTLLTKPTSHGERVGCVMATGETRQDAVELAEYVVKSVTIKVESVAKDIPNG